MSVLGWILAGILGAVFIAAGGFKLASSREKLLKDPNMGWANDFTGPQIKIISALEVLGGLGVILPWLLNVAPVLTPIAAVGCAAMMLGAALVNLRRKDSKALPINVVLIVLAAAVAAIRFAQL